MRCKPCTCYISKYSLTCLIRYSRGIKCQNTGYQISQCKTYVKPAILTGLMPYRLRRGKQFDTNQTEQDLCVCIRFLQTMKPIGSCKYIFITKKLLDKQVYKLRDVLNSQLDKKGMLHLYYVTYFLSKLTLKLLFIDIRYFFVLYLVTFRVVQSVEGQHCNLWVAGSNLASLLQNLINAFCGKMGGGGWRGDTFKTVVVIIIQHPFIFLNIARCRVPP